MDRFLFGWDSGFEALRFLPKGKVMVLGIVTSLEGALESQDDLLRCIDAAARHCSIEQLALSTQGRIPGFEHPRRCTHERRRAAPQAGAVVDTARRVWG